MKGRWKCAASAVWSRPQGGAVDHPGRAHDNARGIACALVKQPLEVLDKFEAISGGRELVFPSPTTLASH